MKRIFSLLLSLLLLVSLAVPAAAVDSAPEQTVSTHTVDLGDGWTMTEELIVQDQARTASKSANRTQTFKKSGVKIAEIGVTGVFRYDGSTVSVTSKIVSPKTTYDGWSFSQSSFTSSGGTIKLSGKLTKLLNTSVPVSITLSCDKDGNIT